MSELKSIHDFIYWIEQYNYSKLHDKIYTDSQIAQIIGKAMVDFFEETNTPY